MDKEAETFGLNKHLATTINEIIPDLPPQPRLREIMAHCITHRKFESMLLVVIVLYSALIFLRIAFEEDLDDLTLYFNATELVILALFVL